MPAAAGGGTDLVGRVAASAYSAALLGGLFLIVTNMSSLRGRRFGAEVGPSSIRGVQEKERFAAESCTRL